MIFMKGYHRPENINMAVQGHLGIPRDTDGFDVWWGFIKKIISFDVF
jgi:hypothetical protein